MTTQREILLLGVGELGSAIASALVAHGSWDKNKFRLTVAVRAETIASLQDEKQESEKLSELRFLAMAHVSFVLVDLVGWSEESLSDLFRKYSCVIHAGAMTLPEGTQLRITRAALAAEVDEYVPWQWGVDYDIIGREGGLGLFREQCDIRDLLRSQSRTKWWILSCGIFMSFLFEDFWGVVVRNSEGRINGIRALGGWDHLLTATHVNDIAIRNAELLLVDVEKRNQAVYIAGASMRYGEFADIVEKVVRRPLKREVWTTEYLKGESSKDPENKLMKYRVVFSENKGLGWDKKDTYNTKKRIDMSWGIEQYMQRQNIH